MGARARVCVCVGRDRQHTGRYRLLVLLVLSWLRRFCINHAQDTEPIAPEWFHHDKRSPQSLRCAVLLPTDSALFRRLCNRRRLCVCVGETSETITLPSVPLITRDFTR